MKHTFKRMMAMLLVIAMILGVMPSVFAAQVGSFTDVQDDAWYAEFVKAVTEAGYMNGVSKDLFNPDGTCTRAMAATVLYRVEGEPPVGGPSTFKDLTADWYQNAVAWAQKEGVVNGVTATTFCPDMNVTREQLVTMIWRYCGEPKAEGKLETFADHEHVAEYAREAFAWAIGMGIINGMPKGETLILAPQNNATRAQFAKIICLAFQPHTHEWGTGVVTKEATCVDAGVMTYVCQICGETKTEVIAPTGKHNFQDGFCTVCNEPDPDVVPPAPGYVAIYNVANGRVMTTETSSYTSSSGSTKDQMKSAAATLEGDKLFTTATNVARFKKETNEAGITTFVTPEGKYLEADGTNIRFVDAPNANTEFILDEVEGGYYIRLANYKYLDTKDQYIEYYTSKEVFTCYGMGADTTMYVFDFYEVEVKGNGDEPQPPESSSSSSTETEPPTVPPTIPEGYVAIYNVAHSKVMTSEVSVYTSSSGSVKDQLKAAAATLEDGKLTTTNANVAAFKMETTDAGITTFKTADGKYLEADGTNLRFVDAPNANTEFILDAVEGGYYIRLANYKYQGTKDQYIEFYTSKDVFTCYGMGEDTTMYVFDFYEVEVKGNGDEPQPPESSSSSSTETEPPTVPPTIPEGYVAIYNVANSKVMTSEVSVYTSSSGSVKDQLKAAAATLEDGKLTTTATNVATFKMETTEAGITTFVTADGKYLEADGTNLRFVDAPNANTEFILDEVEGGYYIRLANYKYQGTKDQYIEFYTSKDVFTCYGMGEDTTMYVFDFYEVEVKGNGDEPQPPESSSSSSTETEPTTEPTEPTAPIEGYVAIYNVANSVVMTTEQSIYNNKEQYLSAPATLNGDKLSTEATNVATFKMTTDENGITTFVTADGKYLEADGTSIRFVDAPGENTEFVLEEVEGGYYIRLANFKYQGTKDQYIEYYTSKGVFTVYGMGADTTMYVFNFYELEGAEEEPKEEFSILFTNDVHTYVDNGEGGIRYSNVAGLKVAIEAQGKDVVLVDAGDHVQGTAHGGYDNGASIISIMNAAGYDLATLGNHEFDYGMAQALKNVERAEFPYVSANFYHEKNGVRGENVLDSFRIFELGGAKVAFVGITTPETFTKSTPAYFMDENGNYIYGISGGKDGAALYADVQKAIDEAKAAGADYIIGLAHLGDDPASDPWNSEDVISHITGMDAMIDGHSHSTVAGAEIMDKNGNPVVLAQTGEYLNAVGKMTISAEGKISVELITAIAEVEDGVKDLEEELIMAVEEWLGTVVAQSEVDFRINVVTGTDADGKETVERLIRKQETNLGDFCADALYYLFSETEGLGCDVAIMNGGGIRANMPAGEISYKTTKTVHTFGNVACLIEVTGQQILDALEWGAKNAGVGENGGFLHVSGLSYTINTAIPSTVQVDDKGVWCGGPTGAYRVTDVYVGAKALDVNKTYKLAGYNYTLRDLGDGFAMFGGAVNIKDFVMQDYLVLANYAAAFPGGVIKADNSPLGADYSDINGEGRIAIVNKPTEEKPCEHVWNAGEVTTAATCTQDGVMTYTCTLCGEKKTEAIKATGEHNYVDGICTDCGEADPNYNPNPNPNPGELTSGQYVIAALVDGKYYAMSNVFGKKINGTEINVTDGKVSAADAEGFAVTLTSTESGWTIKGAENYLTYNTGTDFGTATEAFYWTIEAGVNGSWRVASTVLDKNGNARIIAFQTERLRFGAYATGNVTAGSTAYYDVEIIPVG